MRVPVTASLRDDDPSLGISIWADSDSTQVTAPARPLAESHWSNRPTIVARLPLARSARDRGIWTALCIPCVGTLWTAAAGTSAPARRGSTLPMGLHDRPALDASPAFAEKRVPTWVGGRLHSRSGDRRRRHPPCAASAHVKRPPACLCPVWIVPLPRSVRSLLRSGRRPARDPFGDGRLVWVTKAKVNSLVNHSAFGGDAV
jgi:hypothetical protein